MRPRLEEIYCERIREAGTHGTWEPGMRLQPGDYGAFRRGVFSRHGRLKRSDYKYRTFHGPYNTQNIKTDGISEAESSLGLAVSDPVELVLSGKATVSYKVGRGDEVLVLTRRGRWREIKDINALLEQVQANIEDFPLSWAVICKVFETTGAVVGISSRSTSGFTIGLDAAGTPFIAAQTRAGGKLRRNVAHAARRAFWLSPGEPGEGQAEEPKPDRPHDSMYTPLFNEGYRIRKRWLGLFGRPELVTLDGIPASVRSARSDPVDLLYDGSRAKVSLDEIRSMPVEELFEEVTPELLSEEATTEISSELLDERKLARMATSVK